MPTDEVTNVIPVYWQKLNVDINNIYNTGPLGLPESNNGNYFVPGNDHVLLKKIISLIESANDIICISSFIIDDKEIETAIIKAIEDGIEVYILTSHFKFLELARAKKTHVDEDVDEESLKQHEKLMNNFAGKAFLRSADHIHSKFIIIDPNSKNGPYGLLLTPNLRTKEVCMNTDIAIYINGQYARDIFYQFCVGFWNESQQELLEPGRLPHKTENPNIVIPPLTQVRQTFFTSKTQSNLKKNILNLINKSDGPIKISSYGFDSDNDVVKALLTQLGNGRSVTVFARPRNDKPKTENALITLSKAGAVIYGIMNLHAKTVLVGDESQMKAILMTSNIEHYGLDEGFETGILIEGKKAQYLNDLLLEWEKMAHFKLLTNTGQDTMVPPYMIWKNHHLKIISK